MKAEAHRKLIRRLDKLKGSPDCLRYFEKVELQPDSGLWLSIYGAYPSREIFIEITNGEKTRVQSFMSQLMNLPPEERRKAMPLVDIADAFAAARVMTRRWAALAVPVAEDDGSRDSPGAAP